MSTSFLINFFFPTLKWIKIQLFHGELGDCNSEKAMLCYSQPGLRPPEIILNLSPYLTHQLFMAFVGMLRPSIMPQQHKDCS